MYTPYICIRQNNFLNPSFQGAIGWLTRNNTWLFMCEGALISEKYMLTTVKCTQLQKNDERIIDKSPGVVRFGVADLSDKVRCIRKILN